jgi:hypothetical protein
VPAKVSMAGAANEEPDPFSWTPAKGLIKAVPLRCTDSGGMVMVVDPGAEGVLVVETAKGPVVDVVVEDTGADVVDVVVTSAPAGRLVTMESATTSTALNRASNRRAPQPGAALPTGWELIFMVLVPPVGDALRSSTGGWGWIEVMGGGR